MTTFFDGWLTSEAADRDVIKIKRVYIDICDGNLSDAVIFSQIMYWHGRDKAGRSRLQIQRNGHLWLAKRYEDWYEECRINERTARDAVRRLERLGLIERHIWHFNGKPTVHLRVVQEVFEDRIRAAMGLEHVESSLIRQNPSDGNDRIRQMEVTESVEYYTETTTETTAPMAPAGAGEADEAPLAEPLPLIPNMEESANGSKPKRKRSAKQQVMDTYLEVMIGCLGLPRDTITETRWSSLRGVARQLIPVIPAEDLPALWHYIVNVRGFSNSTENALAKYVSDYLRDTAKRRKQAAATEANAAQRAEAILYGGAS